MIGTSDGKSFEDEAHMYLDPHINKATTGGEDSNVKGVYIIRHGSTKLNSSGAADKIRGWSDVPLSDEGKKEAEDIAHTLSDSGIQVIHHSDLGRAAETAKAIAKTTGAELVSTPKLRPWNVGHLTGTSSADAHPQLSKYACEKPDEKIPDGESFRDFTNRAFEGVHEALLHAGDRKLALVTHHRVERVLNGWQNEGQPESHKIHLDTFLQKGEPPGSAQVMPIKLAKHDN